MRREADVVGFGHGGDLVALGDAAGVRQVGLHDRNPAVANTRLKSKRENMRSPAAIGMCVIAASCG